MSNQNRKLRKRCVEDLNVQARSLKAMQLHLNELEHRLLITLRFYEVSFDALAKEETKDEETKTD